MFMTRRTTLFVLALLGALLGPGAALAQTPETLIAEVGLNDTATITLRTQSGSTVRDLPAGTYRIEVRDHSDIHNFHLTGPGGVDESTSVAFVGTTTWTVTFQDKQIYRYVCDPHSTSMRGSFTIGGGPSAAPPPPPPTRTTTVYATVGPGATISLRTRNGRRIRQVRRGRYRIVVRDRSSMHNFHLTGPGVNKRTTVGFRGTTTWTLRLRAGRYRFVCDPHKTRMRGSFRVT
jgi:plastocyanin